MNRIRSASALALGLVCCVSLVAFGQPASAPASAPALEPKAEALLKQMCAFIRQAKNLTFQVEVNRQITLPDKKEEIQQNWAIAIRRPDHLAIVNISKEPHPQKFNVYYDGREITFYWVADQKYLTEKASGSIDEVYKKYRGMLQHMQAIDLVKADVYAGLMEDVTKVSLAGVAKISETETQELHFVMPQAEWSLWIETGATPWPRKLAAELTSADGKSKLVFNVLFNKWATPTELADSVFTFQAPAGVTKIKPDNPEPEAADNLQNKPAPDFKLALLGGGELELSKLKGQVVILDFWAAWCPPCRKGLPLVAKVAESFKDQGVAFYTINLGDDEKTISTYLDKAGLKIPVALDANNKIAELYKAESIPRTFVIGKDGNVAALHVGLTEDTPEELTKDVQAALAAKPAVPAPDKK